MLNTGANLYASLLESGTNPEKPPFETTTGAFPALEKKNLDKLFCNLDLLIYLVERMPEKNGGIIFDKNQKYWKMKTVENSWKSYN